MYVKCVECERLFDLLDETDAEEWEYGHDCEVTCEEADSEPALS